MRFPFFMDSADCKHESCELFILLPNNSVLKLSIPCCCVVQHLLVRILLTVWGALREEMGLSTGGRNILCGHNLCCVSKGTTVLENSYVAWMWHFPVSSVFILEGIEGNFPLLLKMMWVGSFDCYICLSTVKGLLSPRLACKPLPDIQDSIGKCCWL